MFWTLFILGLYYEVLSSRKPVLPILGLYYEVLSSRKPVLPDWFFLDVLHSVPWTIVVWKRQAAVHVKISDLDSFEIKAGHWAQATPLHSMLIVFPAFKLYPDSKHVIFTHCMVIISQGFLPINFVYRFLLLCKFKLSTLLFLLLYLQLVRLLWCLSGFPLFWYLLFIHAITSVGQSVRSEKNLSEISKKSEIFSRRCILSYEVIFEI